MAPSYDTPPSVCDSAEAPGRDMEERHVVSIPKALRTQLHEPSLELAGAVRASVHGLAPILDCHQAYIELTHNVEQMSTCPSAIYPRRERESTHICVGDEHFAESRFTVLDSRAF